MEMELVPGQQGPEGDDGEGRLPVPVPHLELVPVPVTLTPEGGGDEGPSVNKGELELLAREVSMSIIGAAGGTAASGDADKPGGEYLLSDDLIIDMGNASEPPNVPNATCSNCASKIESSSSSEVSNYSNSSRKLHEVINWSVFDRRKKSMEQKDIKILEMLGNLYVLKNKSKLLSAGELLMCGNCVGRLSQLFQLYNEFLSLSVMSGAVMSKLIGIGRPAPPHVKGCSRKGLSRRDAVKNTNVFTLEGRQSSRMTSPSSLAKVVKGKATPRNGNNIISKTVESRNKNASIKRIRVRPNSEGGKQLFAADTSSEVKVEGTVIIKSEHYDMDEEASSGLPSVQFVRMDKAKPMILRSESKCKAGDKGDPSQQLKNMDSKNDCRRCGKSFKSFVGLKVHYASHLRDDNKFECKECGKKFQKQDSLDSHSKIDHEGFKPHKCTVEGCGRSFRLKDKLKLHIQVMHEKRKPFPCPKCEKSFRTKYHLKIHDVSQHIQGDNSIGCCQCKRKFPSREALDTHVMMHEEVKPFVCSVCQKGFHTISRLKLHVKSHDVIPSCICSVCGKAYKHVRDLRLHEIIHQDESTYRFACGDCPKKFYRIDLLRVHQANEQHFSPETVGPSISKLDLPGSKKKSKLKRRKHNSINDDGMNDEEVHIFDELESQSVDKLEISSRESGNSGKEGRKRSSKSKKKIILRHSNSIQNQQFSSDKHISSEIEQPNISGNTTRHPPENILLGCSQTQGYADAEIDKVADGSTSQLNPPALATTPLHSFQLPLASHTIYPLKDSGDPGLPSFCISAGAEQIGFDVISAYINNLNS